MTPCLLPTMVCRAADRGLPHPVEERAADRSDRWKASSNPTARLRQRLRASCAFVAEGAAPGLVCDPRHLVNELPPSAAPSLAATALRPAHGAHILQRERLASAPVALCLVSAGVLRWCADVLPVCRCPSVLMGDQERKAGEKRPRRIVSDGFSGHALIVSLLDDQSPSEGQETPVQRNTLFLPASNAHG